VTKALKHSCLLAGFKLELEYLLSEDLEESTLTKDPPKYHDAWGKLCQAEGILVPGGFGSRGCEGKIAAVKWAGARSHFAIRTQEQVMLVRSRHTRSSCTLHALHACGRVALPTGMCCLYGLLDCSHKVPHVQVT
jgi:CTP synthase